MERSAAAKPKSPRRDLTRHTELEVYRRAYAAAMKVFELSKKFPPEERYSLIDQIRKSSRSVCTNIAEAWRKRRYPAAFASKLSDSEGEAAETQTWIQFSVDSGYMSREDGAALYREYDAIVAMLVHMISHPTDWRV